MSAITERCATFFFEHEQPIDQLRLELVHLDVFRIVGGMIIAYMGFDMLSGRQTVAQASPQNDDVAARPTVFR